MADKKEEPESPDEEEEEKSSGKLKIVLFAVGGIVLLAVGAGAGFVLRGSPVADEAHTLDAEAEEGHSADSEEGGDDQHEKEASSHAEPAADDGHEKSDREILETYKLDSFVANIADRDRDRYLKIKAELELNSPSVKEELDNRMPHVRDIVLSLLGSKSFEEVRSIEGKNLLREEMLHRINSLLATGKVRQIFFTEFVVQ